MEIANVELVASTDPLSYSRVTTFEQCPRRYRYRYLDGVQEGFDSVEAFMGRQVHSTIEWLYEERRSSRQPQATAAVSKYCELWDRELGSSRRPVRIVKDGTPLEGYRRTGADMVARFHRSRFVSDRLDTIANERHFRVTLGERFEFQGYIDRLARDERGLLHIIDYKTGRRVSRGFSGREAEQVEAYAVALFTEIDDLEEIELALEFVRTGDRVRRRVTRAECSELERRLVARIDAVVASTVFPPNPGVLCRWCGFNDVCDAVIGQRLAW
jgi:putative RecB family exonuclease